jgi:hypothetical protein
MCKTHSLILFSACFLAFNVFSITVSGNSNPSCSVTLSRYVYYNTTSKRELENLLIEEILSRRVDTQSYGWACLIKAFRELGDKASVEVIPEGGYEKEDVIRFTLRHPNIFSYFQWTPGGSNGVYTAIFLRTEDDKIAVVRRGGKRKWLQ